MIIKPNQTKEEALGESISWLRRAAADKNHKMKQFVFSTVDQELALPSSRMVILRDVLPDLTIRFYTDLRSRKTRELESGSDAALLFWDPGKSLQIRLSAKVQLLNGEELLELWSRVQGRSRRDYNTLLPPGSPIDQPAEAMNWQGPLNSDHFGVVDSQPFSIDLLQLRREGHLALRFQRKSADDEWKGGWVVP